MTGNSLVVQWLGLCTSIAGGTGLIPGQGIKISQATRHSQKKKKQNKRERDNDWEFSGSNERHKITDIENNLYQADKWKEIHS